MSEKNNWYGTNWYAPLNAAAEPDAEKKAGSKKTKKKHTGLWISLSALVLAILVVGSSLLFSGKGKGTAENGGSAQSGVPGFSILPKEKDDKDQSAEDFFSSYFTAVTTQTAEVKIERVKLPVSYSLALKEAPEEELSLPDLYRADSRYVTAIKGFMDGKEGYCWGTGVVISPDGLVLTNTHVIEDCTRATVILADDTEHEAKLVGADSISDIAVLKIEADGLEYAEFGDSSQLVVGEHVVAIGNPLGESFRMTMTDGIISAIERGVTYNGRNLTLLQTNTALNEGNSGGPLFNMYGQVIGITNMKMMSAYSSIEGIGFAIPSVTVRNVVNALVKDGEVRGRTSIGITVGSVPDTAKERYGMPDGLYVSAVTKESDAKKQGIQVGDVLTEVNGQSVRTTNDVAEIKDALSVGERIHMTLWRNGEYYTVDVQLMDTNDIYR